MTEFKTEIEKIISEIYFDENPKQMEWTDAQKMYADNLIQLFNKHIEDNESKIADKVNYAKHDMLKATMNGRTTTEYVQDIINILKIKE